MVSVEVRGSRGSEMHYADECPHENTSTRVFVYVCVRVCA